MEDKILKTIDLVIPLTDRVEKIELSLFLNKIARVKNLASYFILREHLSDWIFDNNFDEPTEKTHKKNSNSSQIHLCFDLAGTTEKIPLILQNGQASFKKSQDYSMALDFIQKWQNSNDSLTQNKYDVDVIGKFANEEFEYLEEGMNSMSICDNDNVGVKRSDHDFQKSKESLLDDLPKLNTKKNLKRDQATIPPISNSSFRFLLKQNTGSTTLLHEKSHPVIYRKILESSSTSEICYKKKFSCLTEIIVSDNDHEQTYANETILLDKGRNECELGEKSILLSNSPSLEKLQQNFNENSKKEIREISEKNSDSDGFGVSDWKKSDIDEQSRVESENKQIVSQFYF